MSLIKILTLKVSADNALGNVSSYQSLLLSGPKVWAQLLTVLYTRNHKSYRWKWSSMLLHRDELRDISAKFVSYCKIDDAIHKRSLHFARSVRKHRTTQQRVWTHFCEDLSLDIWWELSEMTTKCARWTSCIVSPKQLTCVCTRLRHTNKVHTHVVCRCCATLRCGCSTSPFFSTRTQGHPSRSSALFLLQNIRDPKHVSIHHGSSGSPLKCPVCHDLWTYHKRVFHSCVVSRFVINVFEINLFSSICILTLSFVAFRVNIIFSAWRTFRLHCSVVVLRHNVVAGRFRSVYLEFFVSRITFGIPVLAALSKFLHASDWHLTESDCPRSEFSALGCLEVCRKERTCLSRVGRWQSTCQVGCACWRDWRTFLREDTHVCPSLRQGEDPLHTRAVADSCPSILDVQMGVSSGLCRCQDVCVFVTGSSGPLGSRWHHPVGFWSSDWFQ